MNLLLIILEEYPLKDQLDTQAHSLAPMQKWSLLKKPKARSPWLVVWIWATFATKHIIASENWSNGTSLCALETCACHRTAMATTSSSSRIYWDWKSLLVQLPLTFQEGKQRRTNKYLPGIHSRHSFQEKFTAPGRWHRWRPRCGTRWDPEQQPPSSLQTFLAWCCPRWIAPWASRSSSRSRRKALRPRTVVGPTFAQSLLWW